MTTNVQCFAAGGVALVYCHWEGFIKASATNYLCFVATQQPRFEELNSHVLAVALRGRIQQVAESTTLVRSSHEFVGFFRNNMSDRAIIRYDDAINTYSNLTGEVFRDIALCVGVEFEPYELKIALINERLVETRNSIVHGNRVDVTEGEFRDLKREVLGMLTIFRDQLSNCAQTRSFLVAA